MPQSSILKSDSTTEGNERVRQHPHFSARFIPCFLSQPQLDYCTSHKGRKDLVR